MKKKDDKGKEHVKIIDFGIAKFSNKKPETKPITKPGQIFGSPLYMSPEQCKGESLDARSDIYSLGCMMFEALTGRPPIVGQTPIETIFRHVTEIPPLVSSLLPDADRPGVRLADEIVARCLEKDPAARYQSALELMGDLNDLESEAAGFKSYRRLQPIQGTTTKGGTAKVATLKGATAKVVTESNQNNVLGQF